MPAPSADFPAPSASTSSSGYTDGLGRRSLAFDREGGTMLERLVVRAELSAFERSLRDRVDRIAALDDERLAKPRSIERGPDGALVVLSEFVPGSRLSDLLDSASQQGADLPGVDVALGFLIDVLPALCGLHAGAGFAHGALGPGRTVLTPAGQVVLLDGIFGDALARLQYSRTRLWNEFAIAMPPAAGPIRFDASADIAQAALAAVMLVLGRPLADDEYPDAVPSLLVEVVDVAQIRGSSEFASGLQRFLQRALPIPGRRPYTATDDALIDVRDLAREIGVDVCRRALVDFIEHQESGGQPPADGASRESIEYGYDYETGETFSGNGDGQEPGDDESALEMDLNLDEHAEPEEEAVYDLVAGSEDEEPAADEAAAIEETPFDDFAATRAAEPEPAPFASTSFADSLREPEPEVAAPAPEFESHHTSPFAGDSDPAPEPALDPVVPADEPYVSPFADVEPVAASPAAEASIEEEAEEAEEAAPEFAPAAGAGDETDDATESVEESKGSRRRKRSRSARSKKDKLRSTERPQPLAPKPFAAPPPPPAPLPVAAAPPPPPAPKPTQSGWMVEPNRAASFEPPVPTYRPPAEPPSFAPPPPQAPPPIALAPPPPPPVQEPIVVAPLMPRPIAVAPPPIPVLRPPAAPAAPPAVSTVKLKVDAAPRKPRPDPAEDIYAPRSMPPESSSPREFPWKIASGALVVLVVGLVAGRAFLTGGTDEKTARRPVAETAPVPTAAPPPVAASPRMGRIQIETQPPGARVLLDGKPAGESPLNLDVPAGRHTLTLATATGSVRRTVKVEAGKTITIDVPIFSGWVDVVAPIVLDVSEGGKSIGTTEQNRLLLSPGRHELTFSNRDLDYSSTHTVDVEPGEARTLTIDPRGTANLNASPWAEVWIDGKKVGDTPLANLQVPLGTHEVVFKHPQFGERRLTTTIRANAPVALSVDMSKPQ